MGLSSWVSRCAAVVGGLLGFSAAAAEDAAMYLEMRSLVFKLHKENLAEKKIPPNSTFAVVMEASLKGGGAYTVVAYADGTCSIYFSSGGGRIGSGEYEKPNKAARNLIAASRKYLPQLKEIKETPLVKPNRTQFFVLTDTGVFHAEDNEIDFGKNRLPLSPFFHKVHELITEIRIASDNSQKGIAQPPAK